MMFTVAHELTHFIHEWSPVKFRKLADLLIERYAEQGTSVRELIDDQILKAKNNGRTIDRDEAFQEVVADSMEAVLVKGNMAKVLAELKQTDKTLAQKIREWFKDLVQKLQAVVNSYKGVSPESPEGLLVAQMDDFIEVLQQAYAEALVDAGESYRASEGNKKTTQEGGDNQLSIRWTQKMTWEDQISGALYQKNNIRRSDTLVVGKVADYLAEDGIVDRPLAIPLAVLSKAGSGKDVSHSIKRGKLAKLDAGIKNAPLVIKNPDRNALVYITNIKQGGSPILVSFDMDTIFDGDSVHKATSIHLQIDVNEYLRNLPPNATIYVKRKNELEAVGATNNLRGLAASIKFIEDMVAQNKPSVNNESGEKQSARTDVEHADSDYLAAVSRGDMQTAQKMVDAAAKRGGAYLCPRGISWCHFMTIGITKWTFAFFCESPFFHDLFVENTS